MVNYRVYLATSLCILLSFSALTQNNSYFVPLNIQEAYQNQTRNAMGLPGANYWQNSVDYKLEAVVDTESATVSGKATIKYVNHSPDTLDRIVFNLYQDIFRKGNSRDWDLGASDLHDGTIISDLFINQKPIDVDNRRMVSRQGTKYIVRLPESLLPHYEAVITLKWKVKLPVDRNVRMGKYSDSSLFVAYWYPQIAVYDDLDGWDMISYHGSVEFYNEFANYDVKIKLPGEFVVWATGEIENPDEVYSKTVLAKYKKALGSSEIIPVISTNDIENRNALQKKDSLEWHYKALNVNDFSFGAGKGFVWDASSLVVDKATGRTTLISAAYPRHLTACKPVANDSRMSIRFMSDEMPGIAFPYPSMTTFCNGRKNGGMESPMMANNGSPDDAADRLGLTFHEIAHSYMPFFMGTNEKKYAWMDEGWASLWPAFLLDSIYPDDLYLEKRIAAFEKTAGKEMDIPPMVPNQLLGADYSSLRLASYTRPAFTYYFLIDALGKEVFMKALHHYMNTWNGKHPMPLDFIRSVELVADQDLSWFFKPWLYDNAYPDLSIKKITENGKVVIENKGGLPLPILLDITYSDQSQESISFSSAIWSSYETAVIIEVPHTKPIQSLSLGNKKVPDVNPKDNFLLRID